MSPVRAVTDVSGPDNRETGSGRSPNRTALGNYQGKFAILAGLLGLTARNVRILRGIQRRVPMN
jgi:hypothetical protein